MLSLALLLIKLAPAILELIGKALNMAHDQQMLDAGAARAISNALQSASKARALASQVDAEASRDHARDNTDSAFDPEFKRKD